MKQKIILAFLTLVFISCGNNSTTKTNTIDSTTINSGSTPTDTAVNNSSSGSTGTTGTTGTGTVSDSGNAAQPGSDTTNLQKMDSSSH